MIEMEVAVKFSTYMDTIFGSIKILYCYVKMETLTKWCVHVILQELCLT